MISTAPASPPLETGVPAAAPPLADERSFGQRLRRSLPAYLYLLPAASILVVFHLLPILYAFYISLFRWRLAQGPFIGLDNYTNALTSADFWESLAVTLFYAGGTIPLNLFLAFLISYALFRKVRNRGLYRMVYFMPYITSVVAAALVWRWIFHAQYGILNVLLDVVGVPHALRSVAIARLLCRRDAGRADRHPARCVRRRPH
ncbi:MAG: sugar ABC transporter permease [Chloroflexi bacterium]|nr:sugar ABC transporter permease [Chloroflexota bacterium]